jgi:hypothetical protein
VRNGSVECRTLVPFYAISLVLDGLTCPAG